MLQFIMSVVCVKYQEEFTIQRISTKLKLEVQGIASPQSVGSDLDMVDFHILKVLQ